MIKWKIKKNSIYYIYYDAFTDDLSKKTYNSIIYTFLVGFFDFIVEVVFFYII